MSLRRIRLELARTPDHPDGDAGHGYEFTAPLKGDGHIDPDGWDEYRDACTVHHFSEDTEEHGALIRLRGGGWAFSYAPGEEDDEPIFRFASHAFVEGEYVTITEHDGEDRTFRVVSVGVPPALRG